MAIDEKHRLQKIERYETPRLGRPSVLWEESEPIERLPVSKALSRGSEWERIPTDVRLSANASLDAPGGFAIRSRVSSWLTTIESCEGSWIATVVLPDMTSVDFAVVDGVVVTRPRIGGRLHSSGVSHDGDSSGLILDLLWRGEQLFLKPMGDSVSEAEISIVPMSLCSRLFEDGDVSIVWRMYLDAQQLATRWWLWAHVGDEYLLARSHGGRLSDARAALDGVLPMRDSVPLHPVNSMLISADDSVWHMCWDRRWFLLHDARSAARVLLHYDGLVEEHG